MIKIEKGQAGMVEGINKIADTIKVTLGPKGKCVAIENEFEGLEVTRDGATVAKAVKLEDPVEGMGAELVKKAALNTEDQAGDGTSSTAVLIQEIVKQGQKHIGLGYNINEIKAGMEKASQAVKKHISEVAIQVGDDLEKIRKVATISANNDPKVGDLIVEGMEKVGIDGVLTAELGTGLETTIDVKEGFQIGKGWASPFFINNPGEGTCELINPEIVVVGEKIATIPQIQDLFMQMADPGTGAIRSQVLFICDDIDERVMAMLASNMMRGALTCCVVKGIEFGDSRKTFMQDVATAVGATYICPENNLKLETATTDMLGSAEKVIIGKDSCTIYGGRGSEEAIAERLEILRTRLQDKKMTDYEKSKIQKRIACLGGGIAVICAGGASEVEKRNAKATIEDAILASKSAISEGVVPGGGYTLLSALPLTVEGELTESERIGVKILTDSLPVITKTIAENAGKSGDVVVNEVSSHLGDQDHYGYNSKTDTFGNLLEMGILDSAKVLRVALENAVSAAGMCLLTDSTITTIPEKKGCCCER